MNEYPKSVQILIDNFATPSLQVLATLVVAILIHALLSRGMNRLAQKGIVHDQLSTLILTITKWLLLIIVVLMGLGFFGVTVTSFWATLSGVLALIALGFVAMWSILSNISCSILLVVFSPFRIGDEIEVQDPGAGFDSSVRGKVVGMNVMFTTLEGVDDSGGEPREYILRIPNNIFFQKYIRRWPGEDTKSLRRYLANQHQQEQE